MNRFYISFLFVIYVFVSYYQKVILVPSLDQIRVQLNSKLLEVCDVCVCVCVPFEVYGISEAYSETILPLSQFSRLLGTGLDCM